MTTKLSTKGQVVLPKGIRRRMNLRPGDKFETRIEAGRIVLVPKKKRAKTVRLVKDRITGLPMLSAGKNAPVLTSEEVAETLSDFP
jgi:AbrB family looped-hinge helix DNA binding protein